jgi:hypothetical protein
LCSATLEPNAARRASQQQEFGYFGLISKSTEEHMNAKLYMRVGGIAGGFLLAALLVTLPGQSAFAQEKGTPAVASEANRPPVNAAKAANAQDAEQKKSPEPSALAKSQEAQNERNESSVGQGSASGNGSHEGIKVHGHWIIEVRDPDGTLVTRREFENSLTSTAGAFLPTILSRQSTIGFWSVSISDPANTTTLSVQEGSALTVSAPSSGANAGKFVLTGSTVAAGGLTSIGTVGTNLTVCSATVAPANCNLTNISTNGPFTLAILAPAIGVSNGQTIAITVLISFS